MGDGKEKILDVGGQPETIGALQQNILQESGGVLTPELQSWTGMPLMEGSVNLGAGGEILSITPTGTLPTGGLTGGLENLAPTTSGSSSLGGLQDSALYGDIG